MSCCGTTGGLPSARLCAHTTTGATLGDLWFLVLIISFATGNHFARTQALKRLQLALEDREQAPAGHQGQDRLPGQHEPR
jgi:hypothetical protein